MRTFRLNFLGFRRQLRAGSVLILLGLMTGLLADKALATCNDGISTACQSSPNSYYCDCACDQNDCTGCGLVGAPQYLCVVSHCTSPGTGCFFDGGFWAACTADTNRNLCICQFTQCGF
jgi:hypothetical protein